MSGRFKPLVLPLALLIAGALAALVAELTARSAEAMAVYGMVKIVSDLTLAIGGVWLAIGTVGVLRSRKPRRSGP